MDALRAMYTHALSSRVLIGIPLGPHYSLCNLEFDDDLLLITTGRLEDLRILKLILLLFEDFLVWQSTLGKVACT